MDKENNDATIVFNTILSDKFFNFDPVNERIMFDPCNDYMFKFDTNRRLVKMNLKTWDTKEEDYTHTSSSNNPNIVKYSPNESILCIRTSVHEITFIPKDKDYKPFIYQCNLSKHSDNMIKDMFWPTETHIFIVMKYGIDILECSLSDPSIHPLKRINEISINISWFVYNSRIFLYLRDDDDKFLNGFHFKKQKDKKIDVIKLETINIQSEVPLLREDIIISRLYDKFYCIFIDNIKHKLLLFQIHYKYKTKQNLNPIVLNLNVNGPVRLNIVDNLIISHNITKNVSMIYDIKLADGNQKELNYIIDPLPIAIYNKEDNYKVIGKYTDCQFIYPDTIVNKGNGQIHKLEIILENISRNINNSNSLINFLLRRKDGKPIIFNLLRQWTKNRSNFGNISTAFFLINTILSSYKKNSSKSKNIPDRSIEVAKEKILQFWSSEENEKDTYTLLNSTNKNRNIYHKGHIVITQDEMYTELFVPIEEELKDYKYMASIISEYIKSLNFTQIKVHSFIYELIIDILVRNNKFYQLHQLLQYYVITDSQHVACQLLYIEQKYPPALQLALDMLKRLNEPSQIIEVLFTKGMVLSALKYLNSLPDKSLLKPLAPRFLEEAKKKNDSTLFHITYNYFKSMNYIDSSFSEYEEYYNKECKMIDDEENK